MATTTRRRAAWGSLTRDRVVEAAERVVRSGGFEQMTIRSLAADLGVAPMSLYRHVRDKDDLLDEVVDRLLRRRWKPRASGEDWVAYVTEAAERFREFLVSQPAALHVYLSHPVTSPTAMERMGALLSALESGGFDEESALRAYSAVHTYTIGFAALEASRARSSRAGGSSGRTSRGMERKLATFTTPRRFSEGLGFLLDGIDRSRRPAQRRTRG
jgi:TetR/AcrR family transcriptional regulator, tetracycline repressor protein